MNIRNITSREILVSIIIAVFLLITLGVLTGLFENSFFSRMTDITFFDYVILAFESVLLGFLLGIRSGNCSLKSVGGGGVLGFLGFACPVCNKLLLYIFGSTFLLSYFEPIRHYVGLVGIIILLYLLYRKLCLTMVIQKN